MIAHGFTIDRTCIKLADSESLFSVGSAVSDDGTDDRKLLLKSIS